MENNKTDDVRLGVLNELLGSNRHRAAIKNKKVICDVLIFRGVDGMHIFHVKYREQSIRAVFGQSRQRVYCFILT